jgi:hypothetical protein
MKYLWSLIRAVLEQGYAIAKDDAAGKYPTHEHLSARLDEAARERETEFEAMQLQAIAATPAENAEDLYYLQDSRQYLGNSIMWWRQGGAGYTSNIDEAGVFTHDQAYGQHRSRETDKPWKKSYIDVRTSRHVDHQKCDLTDRGAA